MKTSTWLAFLVVLLVVSSPLLAQGDFYLPQVANGQAGGLTLKTTFVLLNPTDKGVGVEILLSQTVQGGNEPMLVTLPDLGLHPSDSFSVSLQAGETRFLQTDGLGGLAVGAARVTTTGPAAVSALFTIFDSGGRFITEAGVGTSLPLTDFVIPVDVSGPFNTGLALFNFNLSDAVVTFSLVGTNGSSGQSKQETLKGGEHRALFISELFPQLASFRGTLAVSSGRPLAAIALRQNQATLTSTTFPVAGSGSTIIESQLPQVANGRAGDEVMRTTFILFNTSQATNNVELRLTSGDGTDFPVKLTGQSSASSLITRTLPPGGSAFLQTDGTGDLMVGAASVSADYPIGVVAIFSLYDRNGNFLTEAGVGDAPALFAFSIPVDTLGDADTGLALYNPGGTPVTATVRLLDAEGRLVQSVTLEPELAPRGHRALMVRPTFDNRSLRGALSITANGKLAALTVRLNTSPLSYTTLPRASGAYAGVIMVPPLLAAGQSGVDATEGATVNGALPLGLRLSGTVTGAAGSVQGIVARSEEGELYQAVVNPLNRRYWIALPPGVYRLVLFYSPAMNVLQGVPVITLEDPVPVTVTQDQVRDLNLPAAELFTVSGRIRDFEKAFSASLFFMSGDGRVSAQAFISMEGDYTLQLPSGSYTVSLAMNRIPQGPSVQDLAAYNFAGVTVEGAPLTADFASPQVSVALGTMSVAGLTAPPGNSYVSFLDRSAPSFEHLTFMDPVALSTTTAGAGGAFRAVLHAFRSYEAEAHVRFGSGYIHVPAPTPLQVNADGVALDFELPELPAAQTISGRVTAPNGSGHPGVTVEVSSTQLAGWPGAHFTGRTTTNLAGDYQITVPAGTGYRVRFVP